MSIRMKRTLQRPHLSVRGMTLTIAVAAVLGALCALPPQSASAQVFPSKPIHMINPYAPGGAVDASGRLAAAEMSTILGQQVVVDYRPGANGAIGTEVVARSAPDGYTMGVSGMAPAVLLHIAGQKPGYAQKDLAFVGHVGLIELMITANPAAPYNSVKQLIDAAKASPGRIPYGHGGTGSGAHLAFESFKSMAKIDMPAVAYKGDGPTIIDLMGGQIMIGSTSVAGSLTQIKAGKVKALAVDSPNRSPLLPGVPTVAESGLPGYEGGTYSLLAVPAATPVAVINRLNAALNEAMRKPSVRERYAQIGLVPVILTPAETAEFVARETAKWARVMKEANIQIQ